MAEYAHERAGGKGLGSPPSGGFTWPTYVPRSTRCTTGEGDRGSSTPTPLVFVGLLSLAVLSASPASGQSPGVGLPLRAIHAGGLWGSNDVIVLQWEEDRTTPIVPLDYIEWLHRLHVNWVGLSVALFYDDSMDSTIDRNIEYSPTGGFSDDALRQLIREFREQSIDVYLTLALSSPEMADRPAPRWLLGNHEPCCGVLSEFWPWSPDHPDHRRFVAEFWETYTQQAVHIARIAEEEGARLYSLGTETDGLFRTRSGGHFINDFGEELRSMVDRVRAVYSGLLTYDMHYNVLLDPDFYGAGSEHLWNDLDLDLVGVSAWFPLTDSRPTTVTSPERLRAGYERIFQDHLVPLGRRNEGRPIVFLEYGAMDMVETPGAPDDPAGYPPFVFMDTNGNGLDDGRETQANMYQALLDATAAHPGILDGVFWWDNWIAGDGLWAEYWAGRRAYAIRDKPAEEVVRSTYALWRTRSNRPPKPVGALRPLTIGVDDGAVPLDVAAGFRDPDGDRLTYRAASSVPAVAATGVSGSTLTVTPVSAGRATVTVTASDPLGLSAMQSFRVTVTAPATGSFTDDPLVPGVTPVKAVHFRELRTRIDALRERAGLPRFGWTDPILEAGVTPVRLVHLLELESALAAVYEAVGQSGPLYTERARAGAAVRAVQLMDLRAAVVALE